MEAPRPSTYYPVVRCRKQFPMSFVVCFITLIFFSLHFFFSLESKIGQSKFYNLFKNANGFVVSRAVQ